MGKKANIVFELEDDDNYDSVDAEDRRWGCLELTQGRFSKIAEFDRAAKELMARMEGECKPLGLRLTSTLQFVVADWTFYEYDHESFPKSLRKALRGKKWAVPEELDLLVDGGLDHPIDECKVDIEVGAQHSSLVFDNGYMEFHLELRPEFFSKIQAIFDA